MVISLTFIGGLSLRLAFPSEYIIGLGRMLGHTFMTMRRILSLFYSVVAIPTTRRMEVVISKRLSFGIPKLLTNIGWRLVPRERGRFFSAANHIASGAFG